MKHERMSIPDYCLADDEIRPLEYSAHTLWAEARGLPELIRRADPAEVEAVKDELREAANLILSQVEISQ